MDPHSSIYTLFGFDHADAPFFPKNMSQEESGYFGALGGWAIGFAGALVAIKIAGVATNIQENDSIRSIEADLEREVARISSYNSAIEVAALDAKRACTSVLIDIQAKKQHRAKKEGIFFNELESDAALLELESDKPRPIKEEDRNRQHLIEKLITLVKAIENAVRDPVFIQATKNCLNSEVENEKKVATLDAFFKVLAKGNASRNQFSDIISDYSDVIINDEQFFDFFHTYEQATHNFAAGVNHIRAEPVYQAYQKDIDFLIEQNTAKKGGLNPSEASWLLLGLLLLQEVDHQHGNKSLNHGFLFLALLMGSLPNQKSIYTYFKHKYLKLETQYGASGRKKIRTLLKEYAETIYYPKGHNPISDDVESGFLKELNTLLTDKIFTGKNSILYVKSSTLGLSKKEHAIKDKG